MNKKYTTNGIKTFLRVHGKGVYSAKAIDKLLYMKGFSKDSKWRWATNAIDVIYQNFSKLKELQSIEDNKEINNQNYNNKDRYDGSWRKGVSNASLELLQQDGIFGENRNMKKKNIIERMDRLKRLIENVQNEITLKHGSASNFELFDLKYINTGHQNQSHGYGFYFTDSDEVARDYAGNGYVYEVDITDGKLLEYDKKPNKRDLMRIAKAFFNYYTKEDEYGKEAYKGNEREFWEYECKYIAESADGGDVYGTIASLMGDDKSASMFLRKLGYIGLKVHDEKGFNIYVIFDDKDISNVRKEKIV